MRMPLSALAPVVQFRVTSRAGSRRASEPHGRPVTESPAGRHVTVAPVRPSVGLSEAGPLTRRRCHRDRLPGHAGGIP
eukprot:510415-Hanusia_phi.AAC.1